MTLDLDMAYKIVSEMSPVPWIVLENKYGQIDVIRNPNHPMHKEGVIELWGLLEETKTPDAKGIAYMRATYLELLNEVSSLRIRLDAAHRLIKEQDSIIKEFESW
ncbi:MAG: hypothetical protein WC343_14775 [Bacilli bacterium]|jgi:hypothetical protein